MRRDEGLQRADHPLLTLAISVTSRLTSEFRQWLVEERHINPETVSRAVEKKEMASFIEDYNTATMASDKYYNLEVRKCVQCEWMGFADLFVSLSRPMNGEWP